MILKPVTNIFLGNSENPDPYINNNSLLLHMNGTNGSTTFTDSTINNFTVSPFGTAQITTTIKKFGTGSVYFDGSSYLELPLNSAFNFSTGDFTIEFWAYPTRTGSHTCITRWGGGTNIYFLAIDTTSGVVVYIAGGGPYITGGTIQTNQWYHIALTRQGSNLKAFLNGSQVGSTYNIGAASLVGNSSNLRIGRDFIDNTPFQGYMDEVRITKGVARYTSDFDISNFEFQDSNTVPSNFVGGIGKKMYVGSTLIYDNDITDTDAQTYITRVEEADSLSLGYSQGLEWQVKKAINDFVVGCKVDSIWTSINTGCILAGARTLSGALVPFKGVAPTAFNFTDYSRTQGLKGGNTGDGRYIDTNRLNSEDPLDFVHASAYVFTQDTGVVLGSDNNLGAEIGIRPYGTGNTYFRAHDTNPNFIPSPTPTSPGFVGVARSVSTGLNYIYPSSTGVVLATRSSVAVTTPNNINIFRRSNATQYYNGRIGFYSLGGNLNLSLLKARVDTLMAAFATL
jgi:hypothetical protein